HLLEAAAGKDTQLAVTCRGDLPWAEPRWVDASKWIESASLSPSGARALFSARGEVFSVPAQKGDARNLTRSSGTAERTPVWSPDSKWLAYSKRLPSQFHVLMAYSMVDKKPYQLTDGLSDAVSPAWDAGGKYLYFLASTDFGLSSGWLDLSSYDRRTRRGAYLMVLAADTPSPLLPESDEEARDTTAAVDSSKAK